jgi:hypothetical protein
VCAVEGWLWLQVQYHVPQAVWRFALYTSCAQGAMANMTSGMEEHATDQESNSSHTPSRHK